MKKWFVCFWILGSVGLGRLGSEDYFWREEMAYESIYLPQGQIIERKSDEIEKKEDKVRSEQSVENEVSKNNHIQMEEMEQMIGEENQVLEETTTRQVAPVDVPSIREEKIEEVRRGEDIICPNVKIGCRIIVKEDRLKFRYLSSISKEGLYKGELWQVYGGMVLIVLMLYKGYLYVRKGIYIY